MQLRADGVIGKNKHEAPGSSPDFKIQKHCV